MSFPDICPRCGHLTMMPHVDGCDAAGADDDAEKAALFDVLAARIESGEWDLPVSEFPIAIRIRRTGERVHGATLAEAVKAAMESEGK